MCTVCASPLLLSATVRFRVLGSLEVQADGLCTPQGPRKQKILASLVLNPGRVVTVEQLVEAVWELDPPATAARQIRNTTTELRRDLVAQGAPAGVIIASGPGFLLDLTGCWSDLSAFEQRLAAAQFLTGPDALVELCHALALWRGPALDGLRSEPLRSAARALDERRLTALERRFGLEIDLNGGADVLEEVSALAEQHPFREALVAHLMRAHYLAGRQADALAAYHRLRTLLDEELGVEPGQPVRDLYERILRQDPALGAPPVPEHPVPRQLPPAPRDLRGRSALAEQISDDLADGVVVLSGPGGVGKSALAAHVAHRLAARYPGGQLYADLSHTTAFEVLGRLLRALGVAPSEVPADPDERVTAYRTLLASRRVLVLLDNATSEQQVRPLLPGYPGSTLLITSRRSLAALRDAAHHVVPALDERDAVAMLLDAAGSEDTTSASSLASLCGRLPLALSVAAARLAARSDLTIARLRDRLLGQRALLDELTVGDLDVRGSIALSYHSLRPDAAAAFRRVALLDAHTMPAWVLAAFADQPWESGEPLLDQLLDHHLVEAAGADEAGQSRFRLHDLVHEFASERVVDEDSPEARRTSVERLVRGLTALASTADSLLGHGAGSALALPGAPPPALKVAEASPYDWFESERELLVTAVRRAAELNLRDDACELAMRSRGFLTVRQHHSDGEAMARAVIDCLGDRPDPRLLQHIRVLYTMYGQQDRNSELPALAEAATSVAQALGDPQAIAEARWQTAATATRTGKLREAVESYRDCLVQFTALGASEVHLALTRWGLGTVLADLGDTAAALEVLRPFTDGAPTRLTAIGLLAYAEALVDNGSADEALAVLAQAREIIADMGDAPGIAHLDVAHAYADLTSSRLDAAERRLGAAITVLRKHRDAQGLASALRRLGDVARAAGRPAAAAAHWHEALGIYRRISLPLEVARTLDRLGDAAERDSLLRSLSLPRASLR